MSRLGRSLWFRSRVLAVAALIAGLVPLVAVAPAYAAVPLNPTLTESAPATVLYGSAAWLTLAAANTTGTPMYNASFQEVLPAGVTYVAGSTRPTSAGEPKIIANAPGPGQSTVIWSNVADIQPASSTAITISLQAAFEPAATPLLPGSTYTDAAAVYVNSDPRTIPAFTVTGTPTATSTGSASTSATTKITPISVSKAENSPEAELPRGVHEHKATYTLTVRNSKVHATTGVVVDDYLPAGLEFLGCGGVDNTTNAAGTNPGQNVEYPGAPRLTVGTTLNASSCLNPRPSAVTMESLTGVDGSAPTQPITAGSTVYTHVVWNLPDLAPGGIQTITYLAAVPLRENTTSWSAATPPASGAQGSNLDNNNGVETRDTQSLSNLVIVQGTYSGAMAGGATNPVSASAIRTVQAVDLAIQKSIAGSGAFKQGTVHDYTLNYQTSEYRYSTNVVITDTVPNGLCPLGPVNYDPQSPECNVQLGHQPTMAYTSVTPNLADGTFVVTWSLGTLPTNVASSITMPIADRTNYQSSGVPTSPTLAGDSLSNTVRIDGNVTTTCVAGTTLDPTCAVGTVPIYASEGLPASATNGSNAGEQAPQPVLTKRVAMPPAGNGPIDCTAAGVSYVADPIQPTYQKGDTICFQLEVDFPAGLNGRSMVVTDILPPNSALAAGSVAAITDPAGPVNTVTIATADTTTFAGQVVWTLGTPQNSKLYVGPGEVFAVDLAVTATADPSSGNTFDLVDNLMKLTGQNTAGQAISLRAQAGYQLSRPTLALQKGVAQVDTGAQNPAGFTDPFAHDGSAVTYRLDITNTGLEPAIAAAVSDAVPIQIADCSAVTAITNSGTCSGSAPSTKVSWTNLPTIAAGATLTLKYTVAVPADLVAGAKLQNTAAVTSYQSQPNAAASPNTYTPGSGGEPAVTASAEVQLAPPTLGKTMSTSVTESGNNAATQATIGETVTYTIAAAIPAGTTIFDGKITDVLPAGQTYVSSSAPTVNGLADDSFTVGAAGNTVTATFPPTFVSPVGAAQTVALTVTAVIADAAPNFRNYKATNSATLAFTDSSGTAQTNVTALAPQLTIVEPVITLAKTDGAPSHTAAAGATVPYTITVSNNSFGGGVSTAHDVVVTDTLPAGMGDPTGIAPIGGVYTAASGPTPATIVWNVAPLAFNTSLQLKYSATLPSPATGKSSYLNSAAATATSLSIAGARPAGIGYSASASDTVNVAGATMTKTASPTTVTPGVVTTYTALVTLPAGTLLPNLTAIDTLPDGMTFDAYGTISCARSDSSACASDITDLPLQTPVKNAGTGKTQLAWFIGDVASDTLARTVTIAYTAYPALINHLRTKIIAGDALSNSITANWNQTQLADPATLPVGAFTNFSTAALQPITVIEPNLTITKTASTATPTPASPLTYTLTITNAAANTSPAYDVVVNDPLPAGLNPPTPTDISDGGSYAGGVVSWTIPGPVTAGTPVARTFSTTLISKQLNSGQSIHNVATIAAGYDGVSGGVAIDPARYRNYGPTSGSADVAATFPALSIAKATSAGAASGTAFVGQPFGWRLTVSNSKPAPASAVIVTDTLPAGWSYDSGTATVGGVSVPDPDVSGGGRTLTFTLAAPVTNVQAVVVRYNTTPSAAAILGSAVTNTASVTSAQDASGATGNKTGLYVTGSSTASAIIAAADLTLGKTHFGTGPIPGAPTSYGFTVKNLGPSPTVGLTVTDTLPAGSSAVTTAGAGWNCLLGSGPTAGTFTCNNPRTLALNATDSALTVTLTVPSATLADVTNTAAVSSPTYDPNTANNAASVTNSPTPDADLWITKSHTGSFMAGQESNYQLSVGNVGPSDETGIITATDTLPAGESYVSGSGTGWTCPDSVAGQTVVCTLPGPLPAGTSAPTLTITVQVAASVTAPGLTNSVALAAATPDSVPDNNIFIDPTSIVTSADLSTTKVHIPTFVAGQNGSYAIDVINNGPSDASGPITVTDPLPAGETFVSGTGGTGGTGPQAWQCSADSSQLVTCTLAGPLAAGASAPSLDLTVAIDPLVTGALSNTETVSSPTSDPRLDNNAATDSSTSIVTYANLAIVKTPLGANFTAGQNGRYTLTVSNTGPSAASGTQTVMDTLPPGMSFVSGTGGNAPQAWDCSAVGQLVTCTRPGPLAVTTAPAITLTVALDSSVPAGSITNSATVSDSVTHDPGLSDNCTGAVTQTVLSTAMLGLTKTHAGAPTPGTQGTYTLDVSNTGPSDALAPTVSDPLPAGETFVAAYGPPVGTDTWSCGATEGQLVSCTLSGAMPVGQSSSITLYVQIGSNVLAGPVSNTATASSGNAASVTATDTISLTPEASLQISKTHGGNFTAGNDGSYTIAVTNLGPSDSAGPITVTDTLPAGETYVSANGAGWACLPVAGGAVATVTCTTVPDLITGDSGLVAFAVTSPITLTVHVDPAIADGTVLTNTATTSSPTDLTGSSVDDPTTIDASADVSIVKSHSGDFTVAQAGAYALSVSNAGLSDAVGPITVTDTLPASETFVSAEGSGWICPPPAAASSQTIVCTLDQPLPAGGPAPADITLTVNVLPAAYPSVQNTAIVASPTVDPHPENNTWTDSATVLPVADLGLKKTHSGAPAAGGSLTYTLTATNKGPTLDPGPVTITDVLPGGETFTSATGPGWICPQPDATTSQTIVCSRAGDFAVGASAAVTMVVALDAAAVPEVVNTATVAGTATDPAPGNNVATDTAAVTPVANLLLFKQLSGTTLTSGHQAVYLIHLTNQGPSSTAGSVTVTDRLPTGLSFVSATSPGWTCTAPTSVVGCTTLQTLPINAARTIRLTVLVTATRGSIVNQASVISGTPQATTTGNVAATSPARVIVPAVAPDKPPTHNGGYSGGGGTLPFTGLELGLLLLLAIIPLALGGFLLLGARRPRR